MLFVKKYRHYEVLITKFVQNGVKPEGTEDDVLDTVISKIITDRYGENTNRNPDPKEIHRFRDAMRTKAFQKIYLNRYCKNVAVQTDYFFDFSTLVFKSYKIMMLVK